jgi:pimeloyl-ACP methyl ester carboxylesterase
MELAHHRTGAGEPLVLVHGTGAQWQAFGPVLDALAARRDVIAPDLPGFGASSPLPAAASHTPQAFAEAVAGLLDRLELRDAHVAGFSLGGAVAYELARLGRARSVTAMSPIGFWTAREAAYCRASVRAARALAGPLLSRAPGLLRSAVGRTLLESQLIARPWRQRPEDALQATRGLASCPGFGPTVRDALVGDYRWTERLDVPVTIAWGTRDLLLPRRQAVRARARRPEARHVSLPGCGHVPFSDDPPLLMRVLLEGSGGQNYARA